MGAGAITANIKADKSNVIIRGGLNIDNRLRKWAPCLATLPTGLQQRAHSPGHNRAGHKSLSAFDGSRRRSGKFGLQPRENRKRTEIYFSFKKHLHNPWRRGIFILPLHGFFWVIFCDRNFSVKRMGIFAEKNPQSQSEEGGYFPTGNGLSEPKVGQLKIPNQEVP